MLNFQPISLDKKELIDKYFYKYGENSCQHSFVSMFCYNMKYGDMVCEEDGYLFSIRKNKEDENYRYYFFPMGDYSDKNKLKEAINKIIDDAHQCNKKVCFYTLTNKTNILLLDMFGDKFNSTKERDLFEYIYRCDKLLTLHGKKFQSKRNIISKLLRDYDGRIDVHKIKKDDIDNIYNLYDLWTENKNNYDIDDINDKKQLSYERNTLHLVFDNYEELGIRGIVVYIDNKLAAFTYASQISDNAIDGIVQKADTRYEGIYKFLNREMVRLCCDDITYFNFEEDLGIQGLRSSKLSYEPDILLEKYIVKEK